MTEQTKQDTDANAQRDIKPKAEDSATVDFNISKSASEASAKPTKQEAELKGIVRIIDRDIIGSMPIRYAIARGKGVSFMMANAICSVLKIDTDRKVGHFSSEELKKIEDCARNPAKYNIPSWLFNRRKDLETGEDKHLVSAELDLNKTFDIRLMQKTKTYKGVRHSIGSKTLRGQRTKTGARKKKSALGVQRKKKSGKKG